MLPRRRWSNGGRSRRAGWLSLETAGRAAPAPYSLGVQQQPRRLFAAQPVPLLEGGPAPALRPQIEGAGAGGLCLRPRPGRGSVRLLPSPPAAPARGGAGGRAAPPGPPRTARRGSPHALPSVAAPRPPGGAAVSRRRAAGAGRGGGGGGGRPGVSVLTARAAEKAPLWASTPSASCNGGAEGRWAPWANKTGNRGRLGPRCWPVCPKGKQARLVLVKTLVMPVIHKH